MPHLPIESRDARTLTLDGRELLAFHGCGYLGLAQHPAVLEAARQSLAEGLSTGASRETTGNHHAHERLEEALAEFLGVEATLLTTDGYLADLAALQALADRVSVAVVDADAHPSLVDAARASGRTIVDYGPGDVGRARVLIERHGADGVAVLTDGAFTMQGRCAPAAELLELLPADGVLVVDDSHAFGVLGDGGRGSLEANGLGDPRLVLTASLAKALGVAGGFVAGSAALIARVRNRADAYLGTTPIPPCLAAAALAALDVVQREPERRERLTANAALLHQLGRRLGLRRSAVPLPVLSLPVPSDEEGALITAELHDRGIFVPHVHYPGAPEAGALRIAVTSEHDASDLRRLEEALAELVPVR